MTVSRDVRRSVGKLILILVLGVTAWLAVLILTRTPPEYQNVGIIITRDRLIPDRIFLSSARPARLHLANVSGSERVAVLISGPKPRRVEVEAGKVAVAELSRAQLRSLDGATLSAGNIPGQALLSILPGELSRVVRVSTGDVAVVMTDMCAAPSSITLKRGVPVRLWVTKTPSEAGFDNFTCDALGIRVEVTDGQLATVELEPQEVGEYVFTGTVTPDSCVLVHVVD